MSTSNIRKVKPSLEFINNFIFSPPFDSNHSDHFWMEMYQNLSGQIKDLGIKTKEASLYYNDNKNAWYYIVFVILVFACSFTGLMLNYFRKEERTKELEVLYKDFVERDHLYRDRSHQPARRNSCKDSLKSFNSAGLTREVDGDMFGGSGHINKLYTSHSSSLNSSSYISLLCRRMSFAKSTNTLSERCDSLGESCEEQELYRKTKRRANHCLASRRPSIKFLNETRNTRSTYSLERQKHVDSSNEIDQSQSMINRTEMSLGTAGSLNDLTSLVLPPITRKPSITFSETVSIIKTERRNSSPGSSVASEIEKIEVILSPRSSSEEMLISAGGETENPKNFSASLGSLVEKFRLCEDINQYLSNEKNLDMKLPRITRRQSIDVSKIHSFSPDETDDYLNVVPSIRISQYNSTTKLNTSLRDVSSML